MNKNQTNRRIAYKRANTLFSAMENAIYVSTQEIFDFCEKYYGHFIVHPDFQVSDPQEREMLSESDDCEWDDYIQTDYGVVAQDYKGDVVESAIMMLVDDFVMKDISPS